MVQQVTRRCDYRIREQRKYRVCGNEIPSNEPSDFSLGEAAYVADLCDECKLRLEDALAPFIAIADVEFIKVGSVVRKLLQHFDGTRFTLTEAREWLKQNGYAVGTAGMIRQELIDTYKEAHR